MKTAVLLNSRHQGIPIYVSLLVFKNEYSDVGSIGYTEVVAAAEYIVLTMDISSHDSCMAYVFTEIELTACIEALRYCLGRGLIFLEPKRTQELIKTLDHKRLKLREAVELPDS